MHEGESNSNQNNPLVLCLEHPDRPFHHHLKTGNFQLVTENQARNILEKLKNGQAAVLLCDLGPSSDDYVALLSQLRRTAPDTLCILVNCSLDPAMLVEIINDGQIWKCLSKDWTPEDLQNTVGSGVQHWLDKRNAEKPALIRGDLHLQIMADITSLLNSSVDLPTALTNTVNIIARWLHHDVVSIYIWEENKNKLVLRTTIGLKHDPNKPVMLDRMEGLTGLVFRTRTSLIATPASEHPNYKYIPELGEEKFESYIGAPILLGNRALGVLVGQTVQEQPISTAEEILFQFIASRLSGVIELASRVSHIHSPSADNKHASQILQGRGVSAGYASGPVYFLKNAHRLNSLEQNIFSDEELETSRLKKAFSSVIESYKSLIIDLEKEVSIGAKELEIFRAHLMILQDRSLYQQSQKRIIENRLSAPNAIHETFSNFITIFEKHRDPYMRERAQDFRGLEQKLLDELIELDASSPNQLDDFPEGAIVVAHEITPSQVPLLYRKHVRAIITETGGVTSHTAILAKSLSIPAVLGVDHVCSLVTGLEQVLVDGRTGFVFLNPDQSLIQEYAIQSRKEQELKHQFDVPANISIPLKIAIDANIGFPGDIEVAKQHGLDRVGLYRTEFTFMQFPRWPTILEQFWIYEKTALSFSGPIHIRTLDIGADKHLPYFEFPKEENPLLGLRSIRFSLENLDLFRDQLRAILMGVRKGYPFRILLPMVTHVWEIEAVKELIVQMGAEMNLHGDDLPPLGIMAEVPAILQQIEDVRPYISFLSVGTNDLTQYLLAVDRNSNVVGHLYSSYHPAVIRTLHQIISKSNALDLEVSVCGEMAGDPMGALAIASLGCPRISLTPASAPVIRYMLSKVTAEHAERIKSEILQRRHERDIVQYLSQQLEYIDPRLLDMRS